MRLRPFSVKKNISDFFDFADFFILNFLERFFFDDLLNLVPLSPPKTSDSTRVPHCRFY